MQETLKIPVRYLPHALSNTDKKKQVAMLNRSKRLYKQNKYYTRKRLSSYKSKPSKHVKNAMMIYNVENIRPTKELAKKTGCSLSALNDIVKKGEGAYFSSGSRPNQTAQSWGIARLASAITAGKSAAIDYNILEKGCDHHKRAFRLARVSKKKYNYGLGRTKRTTVVL